MNPFDLDLIIDGEIINTYGGNFTHRDVYHDPKTGIFYEYTTGGTGNYEYEEVTDPDEIKYFKTLITTDNGN